MIFLYKYAINNINIKYNLFKKIDIDGLKQIVNKLIINIIQKIYYTVKYI